MGWGGRRSKIDSPAPRSYPSNVAKKLLLLTVLGFLCHAGSALAAPPLTIPIEQIKPGQVGYGLTVFRGFKVERFRVEVIDVMKNFLPKQDLFLVRVDHPRLRKTGVVGGMSGSPIFINGKLAGALAYGWRFSKEPIAGITPIANMLDLLQRKPRGPDRASPAMAPGRRPVDRLALRSISRRDRWWRLPGLGPNITAAAPSQLVPVTVPLNVAGLGPRAMAMLKESFARYGFEPVQGGGTGSASGPLRYESGGAIGVQLAKGDVSMASTGTVTWVGPKRVLGFGHRMFNAGEIYIPTTTTKIVHTLASLSRSFKIGSPARTLGSLVQDRQAGIMAEVDRKIGTIPLGITMRAGGRKNVYKIQLARHRLLTQSLSRTVVANSLSEALSDVAHATFKVTTRISVKGYPQVVIAEHGYASSGVRFPIVLFSRGLRAIRKVLNNSFGPAHLERLDVEIDVKFAHEMARITEVRLGASEVKAGSTVELTVTLQPYGGKEFTRTVPLKIPADVAGSVLVAQVAGGALVRPVLPVPQDLGQYLKLLPKSFPAKALVVSLQLPTQGLKLKGRVIRDLPPSVLDALNTGTRVRTAKVFRTMARAVHPTPVVVAGKKSIRIRVRSEVPQ